MNKNYNRFIACWLANSIDLLFDSDDNLLYPVPFGEYQVEDYIDSDEFDNFQKSYKQYIVEHNMKIIHNDILDEGIEENLVTIIKDLEDYYGDQFLPCIFEEFFEVDNIPNDLYDIFIDESYIEVEENNTLVFCFDYFINSVKDFLDKSNIKYTIKEDVDYNELINSYNSMYPYKCTYRL